MFTRASTYPKGAISSITERFQCLRFLNFYCHGGFCMALTTIVANTLTNPSAWCHNSKVSTGGWLIPWYRRSRSVSLSFDHLLSNRIKSGVEKRCDPAFSHVPSFQRWVCLFLPGRSREQQAVLACIRTGKPLEVNP